MPLPRMTGQSPFPQMSVLSGKSPGFFWHQNKKGFACVCFCCSLHGLMCSSTIFFLCVSWGVIQHERNSCLCLLSITQRVVFQPAHGYQLWQVRGHPGRGDWPRLPGARQRVRGERPVRDHSKLHPAVQVHQADPCPEVRPLHHRSQAWLDGLCADWWVSCVVPLTCNTSNANNEKKCVLPKQDKKMYTEKSEYFCFTTPSKGRRGASCRLVSLFRNILFLLSCLGQWTIFLNFSTRVKNSGLFTQYMQQCKWWF